MPDRCAGRVALITGAARGQGRSHPPPSRSGHAAGQPWGTEPLIQGIADNPRTAGIFVNLLDVQLLEPEDVSNAVAYLASDEARNVTALAMTVDAGCTQY